MQLSCCEVGVRLHVEVPAQTFELTLAAKTQPPKSKSSLDIKTQPPIYHATRKPIIDVLAPEVTRTLTYLD